MCFNNGQCTKFMDANGVNRSACVCPDGFLPDMNWFHFSNCARPWYSDLVILVIFVTVDIMTLAYLLLVVQPNLKGDLKRLGRIAVAYFIAHALVTSSFHAQNGCFEMCAITSNATFIFADWLLAQAILIMMQPKYILSRRPFEPFKRALIKWTALTSVLFVAFAIPMTVLTSRPDMVDDYNVMAMMSTSVLWVGGVVQIGFVVYSAKTLKTEIEAISAIKIASTRVNDYSGLIHRLKLMYRGASIMLLCFAILIITVPIVFTSLGSFPYFYVFAYVEVIASSVFGLCILLFMKHSPPHQASAKAGIEAKAILPAPLHHDDQEVVKSPQGDQSSTRNTS